MSFNYWNGSNWSDEFGLVPPPQWDGSKFVFIDPTFGDGLGIGDQRIRYVGPGFGDLPTLAMPINVKAVGSSGMLRIRMVSATGSLLDQWQITATGKTVIQIPIASLGISTFDLIFDNGTSDGGLHDVNFTIGEPIRQQVFVYTMNRTGQVGAWSRYVFPFEIDATAQLGETLFLRAGDTIYRVSEDATTDAGAPIESIVQWPWLDFGTPGVTKMLQTVDVVGDGPGTVSLQIGYDQRAVEAFTPAYTIPIDTLTGMPIPIPVSAPTLSVRLSFTGKWSLQAVNVNLAESRRTT